MSFRKRTNKQAHENTKVFCHMPDCYHICTYCSANTSTKDDADLNPTSAAPSVTVGPMLASPSFLPWPPRCRHHRRRRHCRCRCHCHGCHHLRSHRFLRCYCYPFLVECCLPSHCLSCFRHCCLPPPLRLLADDAIATIAAAANRCPLLLPPLPLSKYCIDQVIF